ncbi:MAG: YwiC-like family protein [Myxococcales bacterium]|nr:YwiC-like family protein [Myxococcales bacterium]
MSERARRPRSLWPREHGAYIQLFVPVATSLLATGSSWAGAALALGAGFAFLASEPLRVLIGARGPRMRELAGSRARRRLALFAALAAIAGGTGLVLAPRSAVALTMLLAPMIGFVLIASRRGTVQTVLGESVAAITLAGAGAPVALAGGMRLGDALAIWLGWSLAYTATVVVVHRVLARHLRARAPADVRSELTLVVLCGLLAAASVVLPLVRFATPLAIAAVLVLIWMPRATHLRAVGIAFLATSLVAAVLAITPLRDAARDNEIEASFRAAMAVHQRR